MKLWVSLSLALVLCVPPMPAFGRSLQDQQKIRISSTEVILDVVAKNRRGQPALDLTVEDFEVFEDGIKQPIESFKLITRARTARTEEKTEAPPAAAPATANAAGNEKRPESDAGVSVVALVFDRLSQDARKRAQDAALSYVGDSNELSGYVGVFAINLSLNTVQNFTTSPALVRKGVEKAGALASATFESSGTPAGQAEAMSMREAAISSAAANAASAAAAGNAAAAGAAGAAAGAAGVDQQFALMQERARETFDVLQRDQQGYATTNGLLAIVNSMNRLPGRKAVIFFSEGIAIPPNVQQHFKSVINSANRANVSVYAVDAAGLRAESALKASRDEINARSRRRMDTLDSTMRESGALTKNLERNEDLLNLNPQSGLSQLALETGGAFIGDTNQIGPKLKQVDEELSTYYLLSYIPTNQNYDGKFRNVTVKTKKSGVELLARKGYFAVNPTGSSPLFYYEAMPLAALNNPSKPKEFPLLVAGVNFPEARRIGRTAVEVEAPAGAFAFSADNEKKIYSTDFSIVVLIKDQTKQVVDKLSHHYVLLGPLNSMESAKKGRVLFYRETNLSAGKYDIEAVAYDALSGKSSVNRSTIEIPDADETILRLSSVTIIKRVEQVKEKMESPFLVGDQLLVYPNLGEPISKAANKQMGFYFNVYPAKEQPKLILEILQGAKSMAKLPLKLEPPDGKGRIQYASFLPLESLGPGTYELKAIVSDSKTTVSRSSSFTLVQ